MVGVRADTRASCADWRDSAVEKSGGGMAICLPVLIDVRCKGFVPAAAPGCADHRRHVMVVCSFSGLIFDPVYVTGTGTYKARKF